MLYPRGVKHEIGHAMGYWHTDAPTDIMYGITQAQAPTGVCDANPSARELYHAAIAYRRPVGNTEPDDDPTYTVLSMPSRVVY